MATAIVEKTSAVVEKLRLLIAIELILAAQACDLRGPFRLGAAAAPVHDAVRTVVPQLDDDRRTGPDIEAVAVLIRDGAFG